MKPDDRTTQHGMQRPSGNRFVPPAVRNAYERTFGKWRHRLIAPTDFGIRAYVDPVSHPGRAILSTRRYEPETEDLIRRELSAGDVFLDIGANEGILTALGGVLVGEAGQVIAVEPQSALRDIIEINLRLNGVDHYRIYQNAVGENEGTTADIHLYPSQNTGQSGFVKRPRLGWTTFKRTTERVVFVSPERIAADCEVDRFSLVKVDVEGFEQKVVRSLLPLIRGGRIRRLLLDYHAAILAMQDIDAADIHRDLVDAGMTIKVGDEAKLDSYVLYEWATRRR